MPFICPSPASPPITDNCKEYCKLTGLAHCCEQPAVHLVEPRLDIPRPNWPAATHRNTRHRQDHGDPAAADRLRDKGLRGFYMEEIRERGERPRLGPERYTDELCQSTDPAPILEGMYRPSRHPNVAAGSKLTVSRRLADLYPPFRQTINGLLRSSPLFRVLPLAYPALCLLFACS